MPKEYDQGRAEVFLKAIQENKVDFMLYHASSSGNVFFDLLLVKTQGIPFVIFRHELAALPLFHLSNHINSLYHIYKLAEKIIVLTKMDEQYYQIMGVNAKYIPNINNIIQIEQDSYSKNEGIILWVGRLDRNQKNYLDAVKIMQKVVEYNSNFRMIILGREYSHNSDNELKESIEKDNLQDHIKWLGSTLDMDTWYKKAKIHLVTSSFESFCRVIVESKTYGIPLVTYSMPYLELLKDGKGYIEVPQGGIQEAADAILKLLNDNELCEKLSREAKESIKPFMEFDHEKAWREIFDEVISPKTETSHTDVPIDKENMKLLLETFGFHYEKGVEKYRDIERRYRDQEKVIAPVKNINSSVLKYLLLCATARVDIKLTGSPDHKLTVISCDSEANYYVPEWITKNNQGIVNGYGIVFVSNTGKMEFSVQCESEGGLDVWLRGVDYRNNQEQRIPIWINYKNFTINSEEIFHDDTRISHDKSYHFQKNVKEKETITVSVSWYPDGYQEPPQK